MKFCTECGKQLDSEDVFCGGCGIVTAPKQSEVALDNAGSASSSIEQPPMPSLLEGEKDWLEVAINYYIDDESDLALSAVKKAQKQQQNNKITWFLTADIYIDLKNLDSAIEAAHEGIFLDDQDHQGYLILARAFYMKEEHEKAEAYLQKAKLYAESATSPEDVNLAIVKVADAISAAKSNDMGNAQLERVYNSFFAVYGSVPQEFYYNKDIMNHFHEVQSKLRQSLTEFCNIYNGLPNPCAATTQAHNDALHEMETAILDVQGAIDRGNKLVWNWGRIFVSFMIGLPPFFIGMLHPNIHFLIVVGLAIIAFGLLFSVKPVYKFGR